MDGQSGNSQLDLSAFFIGPVRSMAFAEGDEIMRSAPFLRGDPVRLAYTVMHAYTLRALSVYSLYGCVFQRSIEQRLC